MAGFLLKRNTKKPQKRLGKPPLDYKLKGRLSMINTPEQKLKCQRNIALYFENYSLGKPFYETFCRLVDEIYCNDDYILEKFSTFNFHNGGKFRNRAYKLFTYGQYLYERSHRFINTFGMRSVTKNTQPIGVDDYISFNVMEDESEEFFKACQRSARKIAELNIFEDSESNPSKKIISILGCSVAPKPLKAIKENLKKNIPEKKLTEKKVPNNLQIVPKPAQKNQNEMPGIVKNALKKLIDTVEKNSEKPEEEKSNIGMQALKDFRFSFGDGKKEVKYNSNIIINPEEPLLQLKSNKRNIILDGTRVALGHGRNCFSSKGLENCLKYFRIMGHDVRAVVPSYRRNAFQSTDHKILDKLYKLGKIVFTPSKNLTGRTLANYDDCFILQLAFEWNAAVVSDDNYGDLIDESHEFKMIAENRVLAFTWFKDILILAKAPYGRPGPTIDDIMLV